MSSRAPESFAILLLLAARAMGQDDLDREGWTSRKRALQEVFQKAHEGTLEEPAGGEGETPRATEEGPSDEDRALAALERSVIDLFRAYEEENVGEFTGLVHPSFAAADRSGNAYTAASLPQALSDDFAILDHIQFAVQVGQASIVRGGGSALVQVRWSRRALVETGGQEWILLDQRSIFQFARALDGAMKISAIFGDAIFGLAKRTGVIVVEEGTIDGEEVEEPVELPRNQPPIRGRRFQPPLAGRFVFPGALVDFDAQAFDDTCGGGMLSGVDIDFDCSGLGELIPSEGCVLELTGQFASLDQIVEVPPGPYGADPISLAQGPPDVGRIFAVETSAGRFAIFQIVEAPIPAAWQARVLDCANDGGCPSRATPIGMMDYTIEFRYQADGSRRFKP